MRSFSGYCNCSCSSFGRCVLSRANGEKATVIQQHLPIPGQVHVTTPPTIYPFRMVCCGGQLYFNVNYSFFCFIDEVSDLSSAVISGNDSVLGRPLNDSSPLPHNHSMDHRTGNISCNLIVEQSHYQELPSRTASKFNPSNATQWSVVASLFFAEINFQQAK